MDINQWMMNTIAYAIISNGHEVRQERLLGIIKDDIVSKFGTASPPVNALVFETLNKAQSLMRETVAQSGELNGDTPIHNVNAWIINSLALLHHIQNKKCTRKSLEVEAMRNIIGGIQGNRISPPTRQDLDAVVKKTISYLQAKVAVVIDREN